MSVWNERRRKTRAIRLFLKSLTGCTCLAHVSSLFPSRIRILLTLSLSHSPPPPSMFLLSCAQSAGVCNGSLTCCMLFCPGPGAPPVFWNGTYSFWHSWVTPAKQETCIVPTGNSVISVDRHLYVRAQGTANCHSRVPDELDRVFLDYLE